MVAYFSANHFESNHFASGFFAGAQAVAAGGGSVRRVLRLLDFEEEIAKEARRKGWVRRMATDAAAVAREQLEALAARADVTTTRNVGRIKPDGSPSADALRDALRPTPPRPSDVARPHAVFVRTAHATVPRDRVAVVKELRYVERRAVASALVTRWATVTELMKTIQERRVEVRELVKLTQHTNA